MLPVSLQRAAPWLWALLLNWLLFVPAYACSTPQASFWPMTGRAAVLSGLLWQRNNQDVFRISIDFVVLLLCLWWSAGTRAEAWVRRLLVAAYGVLWIFLAYHHGVAYWFQRTPALVEDVRLGLNLLHFLGSFTNSSWPVDLAIFGLVCAASWLSARSFAALQRWAAGVSWRRLACVSAALLGPAAVSCGVLGVRSDASVLQLTSKRVYYNIEAARAEAQHMVAVRAAPPDHRYDAFDSVQLARKPDFYLVMLEAYGEILATWDMAPAYRELLVRVEQRLARAGYHAASTYSAAPVHSGTSWFSIGTVHTGVLIQRPKAFELLERAGPELPTLTRFFRRQGYRSYALQPGSTKRVGLTRNDFYGHDVFVDAPALGYRGKKYGFGRVPDQYALGVFRERFFQATAQPRYVFFMNVSTHYPWGDEIPSYARDWKSLDQHDAPPASDVDASWPALEHSVEIATPLRRSYFKSIAYVFRLLTEWFEAEAGRDSVIVLLGDHQPRLERNLPGAVTMNTPLHILAKDPAFIATLIAHHGFQAGLYADPQRAQLLDHAGLFSRLVAQLNSSFGAANAPAVQVFPHGLPLNALRR